MTKGGEKMTEADILRGLNEKQREAVCATEGYVRVVAGAGTGKTGALIRRYAYIVNELGISPSNILCLTFTNKAAGEMKRRIKSMLGAAADTSYISTIHGFCARILREDIEKMFYPSSFPILDSDDQKKILEEVYGEFDMKLDSESFSTLLDRIEMYKTDTKYIGWLADPSFDFGTLSPESREEAVIIRYIAKQKKSFALDFADLIKFVTYIFDNYKDVEKKWQERLCYVQVDEFQDVDIEEYRFVNRLAALHHNLFIVGDPDQNIYEWRGSDNRFIINFDKDNQPCKTVIMNRNYRSTPQILAAANSLISVNYNRIKKELYSKRENGPLPEMYHAANEAEEVRRICEYISGITASGGKYSDIALLYRASYLSRAIETAFTERKIPYRVVGGVGFYERAEIKTVIAYLRMVLYGDDLSFLRTINMPKRKMGKLRIDALREFAAAEGKTLYETLKAHVNDRVFVGSKAAQFVELVEKMKAESERLTVSELLCRLFRDSGYEAYIRLCGDGERLDNVGELIKSINDTDSNFGEELTLSVFLQNVALFRDTEEIEKSDCVRMMTVHTAKGLEFKHVILVGMSENVFPSMRSLAERKESALEEERRLAFVAITRASESILITDSEGLGVRGFQKMPSRFVTDDIDRTLMNFTGKKLPDCRSESESGFRREPPLFSEGDRVVHKVFGIGVVECADSGKCCYTIRFSSGIKPISFDFKGLVGI